MRKILITGANGFLGQHFVLYLKDKGFDVIASGKGPSRLPWPNIPFTSADITSEDEVKALMTYHKPDIIIHNAAMSKPDECENNKKLCQKVNVDSTKFLLNAGAEHFIYISTDFIFGEGGPHSEDDAPCPLNFYGETKLKAEELVKASGLKSTIVRPVFIYGKVWAGIRPSFLHWVKSSLEEGKRIKVVNDQLRTPTYAEDICKGIETIITREATGPFHLAGKEIISPYQMAVATAQVLGLDKSLIEAVTAETFPEPVKRAKRSGLKIDKAIRELEYNPVSFEEGVKLTFAAPSNSPEGGTP